MKLCPRPRETWWFGPLARCAAFNHSEHNGLSRSTTDKPQRRRKERIAEPNSDSVEGSGAANFRMPSQNFGCCVWVLPYVTPKELLEFWPPPFLFPSNIYTVLSQILGYPPHPCGRHTWKLLALRVVSESLGGRRGRRSRSYDTRIVICVCLSMPTNVSASMYFRFRVK